MSANNDAWFVFTSICYVRGFMFYLFVLYLFKHTGVQHDFHVRWCSCSLTVIQRVSLVEQKLLSLPGHLGSPPVFSGARSLVFCVVFCRSLFVSLSCFHLTIVLYVLLRLTNSDYPFGIFKLFFLWKFLDQLDFHDHKIEVIA
jgi:hypothetical protein